MKKVIWGFVAMILVIGGAFSKGQAQEKKAVFSLNLGVNTNLFRDSSFDNAWFTLDARIGISVGQSVEISPVFMVAVDDNMAFDYVFLYPGAMLNLKLGNFFIGGGAVLPIILSDGESDSGNLAPGVNFGFSAGHLILTAYFFSWTEEYVDFLEANFIGVTVGYRF